MIFVDYHAITSALRIRGSPDAVRRERLEAVKAS